MHYIDTLGGRGVREVRQLEAPVDAAVSETRLVDRCNPVLLGLSLAGNLVKPLLSLYGTEWRERGYGLRGVATLCIICNRELQRFNRLEMATPRMAYAGSHVRLSAVEFI